MPLELLLAPEEAHNLDPDFPPEFIHVGCHNPGSDEWSNEQFRDVHAFVPLKEDVEWRCDHSPREDDQVCIVVIATHDLVT
jgi:hypothetical protein